MYKFVLLFLIAKVKATKNVIRQKTSIRCLVSEHVTPRQCFYLFNFFGGRDLRCCLNLKFFVFIDC